MEKYKGMRFNFIEIYLYFTPIINIKIEILFYIQTYITL